MSILRPEDLRFAMWVAAYLALVILLLVVAGKVLGVRWRNILSAREWMLAAKLCGIIALLLLLILAQNALDLPERMFVYGRF